MTELIKVEGVLLYRSGDPCEYVIHKADTLPASHVLGQRYKGKLLDKNDHGYSILPEIKQLDGSKKNLHVDELDILLNYVVLDVLATKDEIVRRINVLIDSQEKLIKQKYIEDLDSCVKGRQFLMKVNGLIGN